MSDNTNAHSKKIQNPTEFNASQQGKIVKIPVVFEVDEQKPKIERVYRVLDMLDAVKNGAYSIIRSEPEPNDIDETQYLAIYGCSLSDGIEWFLSENYTIDPIYRDGRWYVDPREIRERERRRDIEYGMEVKSCQHWVKPYDENWKELVWAKAKEISHDMPVEQGDWNSAIIHLHEVVPQWVLNALNAELRAVEAGSYDYDRYYDEKCYEPSEAQLNGNTVEDEDARFEKMLRELNVPEVEKRR